MIGNINELTENETEEELALFKRDILNTYMFMIVVSVAIFVVDTECGLQET